MFASDVTKEIITPSEPSYTVTIRRLSGRKLQRAHMATMREAGAVVADVGGKEVFDTLKAMGGEESARKRSAEEVPADRRFDRTQVLRDGIVSWSAERQVDKAAIDDLEQETADMLFREILTLSRVTLTAADVHAAEEQEGNVSAPSMRS